MELKLFAISFSRTKVKLAESDPDITLMTAAFVAAHNSEQGVELFKSAIDESWEGCAGGQITALQGRYAGKPGVLYSYTVEITK